MNVYLQLYNCICEQFWPTCICSSHQVKQLQAVHSAALISVTALNAAGARLISTINSAPFPCWNQSHQVSRIYMGNSWPKNASFREVVDMWYVIFLNVQPFAMQRFGSLSNWNNHLYNQWLVIRFQEWRFLCNGQKSPRHRRRSCHPSRRPPGHLSLPGARLVLTWGKAKLRWLLLVVCRFHFEMTRHGTFHDFSHSWISPPDFDTHFWGSVSVRLFNENLESFCETWQAMSRTSLSYLELDALVPQGDKWKIRWTNWDDDDAIQYMFQKTETSW